MSIFCRFIEDAKSREELNETLEEADEKTFFLKLARDAFYECSCHTHV